MSSREIITLQLGNYSNYVGTHWWNMQESTFSYDPNAPLGDINHDILFREGRNSSGQVTYTPRLLLVDLKGCLQHLPQSGGLYDAADSEAALAAAAGISWDADGQVEVRREEAAAKPLYQRELDGDVVQPDQDAAAKAAEQKPEAEAEASTSAASDAAPEKPAYNFSETVRTWTDFTYSRYHPRSLNIIASLAHSPHEANLDTFAAGAGLWRQPQFEDEFADRIRQYAEECNSLQGFQMLWDAADGFGGLAARGLEHLRDEYGKQVLGFPCFDGHFRDFPAANEQLSDTIRVANIALSYSAALGDPDMGAGLLVPLSTRRQVWRSASGQREFPHFEYNVANAYESSAVLASYVDTITQEYRAKAAGNSLASFCTSLNNYGRRLAGAAMALPFRVGVDEQLIAMLDSLELETLFTQLSPNTKIGTDRVVQHVSVRGVSEQRLKHPLAHRKSAEQMRMAAYRCESAAEMLQLYFQCSMYGSLTHVRSGERGMSVRQPWPRERLDARLWTPRGEWQDWEGEALPDEVPVMAAVQTGCDLARTLETLHREAARVRVAKVPRFAAAGLEADEYAEALERLAEFADNYDDAFEL